MRAEGDAVRIHQAHRGERHDLKPAAVGQDRPRPVHEAVEATERLDAVRAGAEHQVIGVAEHDRGARRADRVGGHRLDRPRRADRHEDGGLDRAVRGPEAAGPRGAVPRLDGEPEGLAHDGSARVSRQASPYE